MCSPSSVLYSVAVLITIFHYSHGAAQANPQLDLPPLISPTIRPEIYYNGYTPRPSPPNPLQNVGDYDRSQRYGPPYRDDSSSDDGADDFRVSAIN